MYFWTGTSKFTLCLNCLQLNRAEFESLGDEQRVEYEGFRPGLYCRVEINNMPCEFIEHFNPTYPLIVGGLQNIEGNIGYVQVTMRKKGLGFSLSIRLLCKAYN